MAVFAISMNIKYRMSGWTSGSLCHCKILLYRVHDRGFTPPSFNLFLNISGLFTAICPHDAQVRLSLMHAVSHPGHNYRQLHQSLKYWLWNRQWRNFKFGPPRRISKLGPQLPISPYIAWKWVLLASAPPQLLALRPHSHVSNVTAWEQECSNMQWWARYYFENSIFILKIENTILFSIFKILF